MPEFEITSPDGAKYRVTAPEGATEQDAMKRVQAEHGGVEPQRGAVDKLLGLGGERYQTWPERAVRDFSGLPKTLIDSASQSKVLTEDQPTQTERMVGPAIETAAAITPVSPALKAGRAALAGAGPGGKPPTQEALEGAAKAGYKNVDALGVELKPEPVLELAGNIRDSLLKENFRDYLTPKTFRAIEELREPVSGKYTVSDLDGVRKLLGRVAGGAEPTEKAAATHAIEMLDDYLGNIPKDHVLKGDSEAASKVLSETRGNYAASKRSERVTEAGERGERQAQKSGSGANLDNALRQRIDNILNSPKLKRGFSPEEIEQMEKIVKGTRIGNTARLASKLGPSHPLTGWGTAIAGDLSGGAGVATATLGTGAIAQMVAEQSTLRQIRKLDEMVRSRSPLAGPTAGTDLAKDPSGMERMALLTSIRGLMGALEPAPEDPLVSPRRDPLARTYGDPTAAALGAQ